MDEYTPCRAPHGARGLKRVYPVHGIDGIGRAPHGARGLKRRKVRGMCAHRRRAPHGARGLKRRAYKNNPVCDLSRPARGAWIETDRNAGGRRPNDVAPRTGRVD